MAGILLIAVGMGWHVGIVPQFDIVEINHKLDASGNEQFVQVLAWNWDASNTQMNCEGWRLVKSWRRIGPSSVRFLKDDMKTWEEIKGDSFRETWTYHDPETDNRDVYPTECRTWISQH